MGDFPHMQAVSLHGQKDQRQTLTTNSVMLEFKVGDRVEWISTDRKIKILSPGVVQFVTRADGADAPPPHYVVKFPFGRFTLPGEQLSLVSSIPEQDVE